MKSTGDSAVAKGHSRRQFLLNTLPLLGGVRLTAASAKTHNFTSALHDRTPSVRSELLRDPRFLRGCKVLRPAPGRREVYAELSGTTDGPKPVWELAQWASRHRLANEAVRMSDGSVCYANPAKQVIFGAAGTDRCDLTLAVNGSAEYGLRARKQGEPWVHLLVEQSFAEPPSIAELRDLVLGIEIRLLRAQLQRTGDYTPELHAAQFQLFLTVQNRNRESSGFGKFLWFGVPFYDDRYREPSGHVAQDTAGSNMFIYTPPAAQFFAGSTHDGDWTRVDQDLLPRIHHALESTWERGHLTESRELTDYRITTVNLGWEVPGIFDVAMQVRGLSLRARL